MSSRRKKVGQKAGSLVFKLAERAFLKRSPSDAERLGVKLAEWAWRVDKKHRNRSIANLELAFPQMPLAKRMELALEAYRHFGRMAADFMRAEIRDPAEVLASVEVEGEEHFHSALADEKGVLMLGGHFGNWERLAHYLTIRGYPIAVVARDANDTDITLRMTAKRAAQGVEVLSRGSAARTLVRRLKQKSCIGLLADQNAGDAFIQFFGKPCGTVLGPATLHKLSGAPILPAYCFRSGPGKYHCKVFPPIRAMEKDRSLESIMQEYHSTLESMVREHPDQWLWMHDRWKSARRAGLL